MTLEPTPVVERVLALAGTLSDTAVREVSVALVRGAVSRQSLREWVVGLGIAPSLFPTGNPELAPTIVDGVTTALSQFGIACVVGGERIQMALDVSKGGWSNLTFPTGKASVDDDFYLYVAERAPAAFEARDADEAREHRVLGGLLGIPDCCSAFFSQVWPAASKRQGDLVPYSCAMTADLPYPWDFRTNVAAQYFGVAPISFFPCSFRCEAAAAVGAVAYEAAQHVPDPSFSHRLANARGTAILYTERHGIAAWRVDKPEEVAFPSRAHPLRLTSDESRLSQLLRRTERLEVRSPHDLVLHTRTDQEQLEGPDVALCVF